MLVCERRMCFFRSICVVSCGDFRVSFLFKKCSSANGTLKIDLKWFKANIKTANTDLITKLKDVSIKIAVLMIPKFMFSNQCKPFTVFKSINRNYLEFKRENCFIFSLVFFFTLIMIVAHSQWFHTSACMQWILESCDKSSSEDSETKLANVPRIHSSAREPKLFVYKITMRFIIVVIIWNVIVVIIYV